MDLPIFLAHLKSKVIEGSHKGKICFLIFGYFFSKCTFLRLWHFFFLAWWLSNELNFSVAVHMITKLFRVVTYCKELHDISREWSCGVTRFTRFLGRIFSTSSPTSCYYNNYCCCFYCTQDEFPDF